MSFNLILPQERIDAMTAAGLWPNRLLTDYLDAAAQDCPDQVAIVDFNSMTGKTNVLSYRQLQRRVNRIALGLVELGIQKNDIVSVQLPNWWELTAVVLACARIGVVINPLMPIFRQRELKFMLGFAQSKVMVLPQTFRDFDFPEMIQALKPDLPALEHLLVVNGTPAGSFEQALLNRRWEDEKDGSALFQERQPGANEVCEVQYTSGTTGNPKGVMHTANTLLSNLQQFIRHIGLTSEDIVLMSSPMAHQTGFLYGILMPILLKTKSVYQDIWDAGFAAQRIQDEGVTFTMASTPFLSDMTYSPAVAQYDIQSLRIFLTAGAPIPRILAEKAAETLAVSVVSAWGMTENGAVTATKPNDPPEKVFNTDGCALAGMEVRVVDEQGQVLPFGEEGHLQARGMCNFVGYLRKPEHYETDATGWFVTGDLARMDREGYIRISGRGKDLIIRGGENIPVVEVEELLYRHPAIQDAAIVGMPDPRMGERGCVFVVLREGKALSFSEMIHYLEEQQMARQYFPERLEIVPEMPRTASGKIQKFRLREMATQCS